MKVRLHNIEDRYRKYAVIVTFEEDNLLLVRHNKRDTWEIPGGHHEDGETISETAERELYEETGAIDYDLKHIYDYSVERDGHVNYGGLFRADIKKRGTLPQSEIAEVKKFKTLPPEKIMTYGKIQHRLLYLIKEAEDDKR